SRCRNSVRLTGAEQFGPAPLRENVFAERCCVQGFGTTRNTMAPFTERSAVSVAMIVTTPGLRAWIKPPTESTTATEESLTDQRNSARPGKPHTGMLTE